MAAIKQFEAGPAIGIDLGTSFSRVAVVRDGRVEVIANAKGDLFIPSIVRLNERNYQTKSSSHVNTTIFDAKRLIGCKFNDLVVQKDFPQWPFKVIEMDELPLIEIAYESETAQFSPIEISAIILAQLKRTAESYLNVSVVDAVVSVPACFNALQREATKAAAAMAGLNVTRLVNEPTAAALAYGLINESRAAARTVLVFSLGGGSFDVSILNVFGCRYEVKATRGDTHLGGKDFVNRIVASFIAEIKQKYNIDITFNQRDLRRLWIACEQAMQTLSISTNASIVARSICGGVNFDLCRCRFESLCSDLFGTIITAVKDVLKDAALSNDGIDEVVLVGGIPKICEALRTLFDEKKICQNVDADQAVVHGAALLASAVRGEISNISVLEVTPLGLNFRTSDDKWGSAIERNTPIPTCRKIDLQKWPTDQTEIHFPILQAENCLGRLSFTNMAAAQNERGTFSIFFCIDGDGMVGAKAQFHSKRDVGRSEIVENLHGPLTKEEMAHVVDDYRRCRNDDSKMKQYSIAQWILEQYRIVTQKQQQHEAMEETNRIKCDEVLTWLTSSCRPNLELFTEWKDKLESIISRPKSSEEDEPYYTFQGEAFDFMSASPIENEKPPID